MTVVSPKMQCPKCGAEMNCHAEKVVYGVSTGGAEGEGDWFNASLQEFHACPRCGAAASRNVGS